MSTVKLTSSTVETRYRDATLTAIATYHTAFHAAEANYLNAATRDKAQFAAVATARDALATANDVYLAGLRGE